MTDFTFEGKQKSVLLAMIGVGVISMILTFLGDDAMHTRFWTNMLHNSVFFTGIAFAALFILAASITAYAGWYTVLKRVFESYALFLGVGLGLMGILALGVFFDWHHLYHWADEHTRATDPIIQGKAGFLNKYWYAGGTFIILGLWYFFATKLRSLSVREDSEGDSSYTHHRSMRFYAAAFLPIAGFSSAAMIWQWVMSLDAHWYSTMFAWYSTASWVVAMLAATILMLIYLKSKGYYENVTKEHLHDLGKLLFGVSVFWTYLWFSQYMLIWYANVGEETVYFRTRRDDYTVLFYGNLIINFALPFLILMRNSTKRKYGTLIFVSILTFFGHWWDFFMMIKPGALHTAHELAGHGHGDHGHGHDHAAHGHDAAHALVGHEAATHHALEFTTGFTLPGFLELGTFIGFIGLFVYFAFYQLSKAKLNPEKDPYYSESMHHHA